MSRTATTLIVMEVAPEAAQKYGIVRLGPNGSVAGLGEKPKQGTEPSNVTLVRRYALEFEIFDILRVQPLGHGGEIQMVDGIDTGPGRAGSAL